MSIPPVRRLRFPQPLVQRSHLGPVLLPLGLFRGDLLPDDRFELWAEERRELFRMRLFRLALGLAAELEQAEDLGRASCVLDRVIELDPLNEEAHLRLARVQVKTGHRHLALLRLG